MTDLAPPDESGNAVSQNSGFPAQITTSHERQPPHGRFERTLAFSRHYVRDAVYAANDGVITTFAIVAAIRGAEMSSAAALVLGLANLVADGLSMGAGN